jgi:hypothetical protein
MGKRVIVIVEKAMDKLITAEMLAGCEQEDLRHSGAIMSHGALLHVSAEG